MLPSLISDAMALFFVWLFAISAIHKVRNPNDYLAAMTAYLPGTGVGKPAVLAVALVECLVAVTVALAPLRTFGLIACAIVLTVYAALMARHLSSGRGEIKCGCAGPASRVVISPALVLRNFICAAAAVIAMTPTLRVDASYLGSSLTLTVAAFMIIVYLTSEQLIGNAQQMVGER